MLRVATVLVFMLLLSTGPSSGARAQGPRPGVRIQFAAVDSSGGIQGRAFLPLDRREVRHVPAAALRPDERRACPDGTHAADVVARIYRGTVQTVHLRMTLPATRPVLPHTIDPSRPCEAATIETRLEDGTLLSGGMFHIRLEEWAPWPGGKIKGTFSQTADVDGSPVAITGSFLVPVRRDRTRR